MMDLLSFVGLATKRRGEYLSQAKSLAKKYKDPDTLEQRMAAESVALVKGYRDKLMRWEEYERTVLDKTLTSALAAVILGVGPDKADNKLEKAWPIIVGDMIPPLSKFLAETKEYVDTGVLRLGDQTLDFADYNLLSAVPGAIDLTTDEIDGIDPTAEGTTEANQGRAQGKTWPSLADRVSRYLSSPVFAFFSLGEYMVAQDMGFKEMRRMAKQDKKTCVDCKNYNAMGWQPFGELPMPGKGCRCYDRCRCGIEYR
jgi:hypothetical protein